MNIQETYNDEASIYENTSRAVNIFFDESLDELVNNINIKNDNIRILDVCCGTGILTNRVANKYPQAEIVGIDFSEEMLNIAKERMKDKNFKGILADVTDASIISTLGEFDLIVTSFGIHNIHGIDNKRLTLNSIINKLKPNGQYITCDILKGRTDEEIKHFSNFQKEFLLKSYNLQETEEWIKLLEEEDEPLTLDENISILESAGLKDVKCIWQKEYLAIWEGIK